MYLTASIPPQVGFYIARLGDAENDDDAPAALAAGSAAPVAELAPVKTAAKKAAAPAKKRAPRPAGP